MNIEAIIYTDIPVETGKCAVETTLHIIGGKWKPIIIFRLLGGTKRFSELQRSMPNVTRRMLTGHLRELERDGIVHREVYKQVPPKVEYSLTDVGRTLQPLLDQVLAWGLWYNAQANGFVTNDETAPAFDVSHANKIEALV